MMITEEGVPPLHSPPQKQLSSFYWQDRCAAVFFVTVFSCNTCLVNSNRPGTRAGAVPGRTAQCPFPRDGDQGFFFMIGAPAFQAMPTFSPVT